MLPALEIRPEAADAEDARALIAELDAELAERYPSNAIHGLHPGETEDPRLVFLIARSAGEPVACGALRPLVAGTAEIKRMFVRRNHRGRGIARAVLEALEATARHSGYATLVLETGTRQPEALALYRRAGYVEREPYGEYVGNPFSVCMTKRC
jgi:putative acetyltransferase